MQEYKTLKDLTKILNLFNNSLIEEYSVSDISKMVDMSPSKISRMLATLEGEGFFEKNIQNGKYGLGIAFFELGMVYASHFPLSKIIRPHIEEMAKQLKLTASWGILKHDKVFVVDRIQNLHIDLLSHRIGLNLPIHSTSIGKILLAYLDNGDQDRILRSGKLTKFTEKTIIDPEMIKEKLKVYHDRGYSTDEGETHKDICCMAAPLMDRSGTVIAAINLMAEKSQISAEKLFQLADYLKEKALFISRQLGYSMLQDYH